MIFIFLIFIILIFTTVTEVVWPGCTYARVFSDKFGYPKFNTIKNQNKSPISKIYALVLISRFRSLVKVVTMFEFDVWRAATFNRGRYGDFMENWNAARDNVRTWTYLQEKVNCHFRTRSWLLFNRIKVLAYP